MTSDKWSSEKGKNRSRSNRNETRGKLDCSQPKKSTPSKSPLSLTCGLNFPRSSFFYPSERMPNYTFDYASVLISVSVYLLFFLFFLCASTLSSFFFSSLYHKYLKKILWKLNSSSLITVSSNLLFNRDKKYLFILIDRFFYYIYIVFIE